MLESRPATLLKRDPNTVFSREYSEIFKNNYFVKHLRTTASKYWIEQISEVLF